MGGAGGDAEGLYGHYYWGQARWQACDCGERVGVRACVRLESATSRAIALLLRDLKVAQRSSWTLLWGISPPAGRLGVGVTACVRAFGFGRVL